MKIVAVVASVLLVAACAASKTPAGTPNANSCAKDSDCVLSRGDPLRGSCVMLCTEPPPNGALAPVTSVPCASGPPLSVPAFDRSASEHEVGRELDDFHDAASHADEARYFAHFAPGAVFLGTDATERWDLMAFRAYAHPHFTQGRGWTYHSLRRAVSFSTDGTMAWFDEDLLGERVGPTRGAGVLVRIDGRWKIALYDLSVTIPNERFDAVRAVLDAGAPGR